MKKKKRIFLNSPLATLESQVLNNAIKSILDEEGYKCIIPQEILPPDRKDLSETKIFKKNIELVRSSDTVISVLDSPGEGVIFELAMAHALDKPIIVFRSDERNNLGKMVEGFYKLLPNDRKARNLDELRSILRTL